MGNLGGRDQGHRGDEPVAAARQRLDEARRFGGVSKGRAQVANRVIHALFKVNESVVAPEFLLEILAGDQFAGPRQ